MSFYLDEFFNLNNSCPKCDISISDFKYYHELLEACEDVDEAFDNLRDYLDDHGIAYDTFTALWADAFSSYDPYDDAFVFDLRPLQFCKRLALRRALDTN